MAIKNVNIKGKDYRDNYPETYVLVLPEKVEVEITNRMDFFNCMVQKDVVSMLDNLHNQVQEKWKESQSFSATIMLDCGCNSEGSAIMDIDHVEMDTDRNCFIVWYKYSNYIS